MNPFRFIRLLLPGARPAVGYSIGITLLLAPAPGLAAETHGEGTGEVRLSSPDGRVRLTFALGHRGEPGYRVSYRSTVVLEPSRLGFVAEPGNAFADGFHVAGIQRSSRDERWRPLAGEHAQIRDHFNAMTVGLADDQQPPHEMWIEFRAYDEGVAMRYEFPGPVGSALKLADELTEFRFAQDHQSWQVYSAQGDYRQRPLSEVKPGCERPLTVDLGNGCWASVGEAALVDFARMKLQPSSQSYGIRADLAGPVKVQLPCKTPWRFVLLADSPGQLIERNYLVANLNDPCALTNTAWIKPGKVIREVTLSTTGGLACVDFAVKHHLQFIEFDAGWYGPESTTTDATHVNVDPARSPGPLDLQRVIDYGNSNGVGAILYVNQVALTPQIDILPALYRSWGVKGMKFGFVNVGSQYWTSWLHDSIRKCATNEIMVDVHDEYRMTGWSRTYPNFLTAEGISGDEATPSTAQDMTLLFTRMICGPGDHTVCFYDQRVTNNWNHAYQLAKAVCFFSPWQFIHWYDRPTNSPNYVADGNAMITEDPALEFYDYMPTVWDDTKVIQGSIGQYAVIARRSGEDWFIGAMNAGTTRTLDVPLDFLTPGKQYIAHRFHHDPALATRTHVRIERTDVTSTNVFSLTLAASDGEALRITPMRPPGFQSLLDQSADTVSLTSSRNSNRDSGAAGHCK